MDSQAQFLIVLGGLLLLGLVTHFVGRRTALPRVTLLVLFGILVGPSGLGMIPDLGREWFPTVANMALVMIGFLLGERLTPDALRRTGRSVLAISFTVAATTVSVVFVGLLVVGAETPIALLLAAIAVATAPAATADVIAESGSTGFVADCILGVVAVDDAWGVILFSLLLAAAQTLTGAGGEMAALTAGAWEVGGAALLGVALGIPMAYFSGRIEEGEPTLFEALGVVFVCGGLAIWLEVSFLLASIVLGATVANLAKHHTRPFHAIEGIESPFMILFFTLAGASLEISALSEIGALGAGYVGLRILGRMLGGWLGAPAAGIDKRTGFWIGVGLLPQAGVALGMALLAAQRLPEAGQIILPVTVASTVLFELLGPLATKTALIQTASPAPLKTQP